MSGNGVFFVLAESLGTAEKGWILMSWESFMLSLSLEGLLTFDCLPQTKNITTHVENQVY